MLKASLLAAAAVLSFSTMAHATSLTIDMTLGGTSNSISGYGVGSHETPNYDLATSGVKLDNAFILYGHNHTHVPKGHLYQNDYVDVDGGGHATFNIKGNYNTFGFKWGTIDKFNSLIITDARGVTYKITGAEMLNYMVSDGYGRDQSNVVFTDPFADIVKVKLLSGQDSFEAANFFVGNATAVPLPATSMLFAMALAGLAFLGWKKHQQG